jgi:membrane-bound metal-dependent hydrolase YbcI (DUF457 family)
MASIVGHTFAGIIAKQLCRTKLSAKKERLLLCLSIFLALMPDLDIVIYILLRPSGMIPHRGLSHGIPFIAASSFFLAVLTYKYFGISKGKLFIFYFSALFSHLALDFFMGAGPKIAFFAPFSDLAFLSPITLIPWAYYSTTAKSLLQTLFYPPAILGFCLESLIFLPLALSFKKSQPNKFNIFFLATSLLSVIFTISYYN